MRLEHLQGVMELRHKSQQISCGGIVITSFVSYKINDGKTFESFLKSWAAVACNNVTEEAEGMHM